MVWEIVLGIVIAVLVITIGIPIVLSLFSGGCILIFGFIVNILLAIENIWKDLFKHHPKAGRVAGHVVKAIGWVICAIIVIVICVVINIIGDILL